MTEEISSELERKRRPDSLGWLTESAVMPKKQRAIEGVSAASIVELRAQLYKSQEIHNNRQENGVDGANERSRRKAGINIADIYAKQNAGVEARAEKDRLQLKATTTGADSYAALEKKAQLYEKLVQGELSDEEEVEKYSVDFFRKGTLEEEAKKMGREGEGNMSREDNRDGGGDSNDWPEATQSVSGSQHKQLVREVAAQTTEAREKAGVLKQQRQLQANRKREKLRQAFLKKQMEKLQAAKAKSRKVEIVDKTGNEVLQ